MSYKTQNNDITTEDETQGVNAKPERKSNKFEREQWFYSRRVRILPGAYAKAVGTRRHLEKDFMESKGMKTFDLPNFIGELWTPIGPSVVFNGLATPPPRGFVGPSL